MKKASRHWRRTPPAIFPICLAQMALGLGWRNAAEHLPIAHEIGDLLLGYSTAFYAVAQLFYIAKLLTRPGVLFEDMRAPPARGGMAASAMSMMLLAAALLPFNLTVPEIWWTGVVMQIAASAIVLHAIWIDSADAREFTPFLYLTVVGPIVAPIAGIPLGHITASIVLALASLAASTVVTLGLGYDLLHKRPPPANRPPLAIFLAPNCLFGIAFGLLGYDWPFELFYWTGWVIFIALVLLIPWLTKAGFSPLWAGFTFPSAAFLNLQIVGMGRGMGQIAEIGTWIGLCVATPVVLLIGYRLTVMWITGDLADQTKSATA